MKIAYACEDITPDSISGGIASYVKSVATALSGRGHSVSIIGSRTEGIGSRKLAEISEVFIQRRSRKPNKLRHVIHRIDRAKALKNYFQANSDFDIVETPLWNAEGLLLGANNSFRHVVRAHTPHAVINRIVESEGGRVAKVDRAIAYLEKRSARKADWVLGNSASSLDSILKTYGLSHDRASFCYHGIPLGPTVPKGSTKESCDVLFWGRLEPRKGIDLVLSAVELVCDRTNNIRFHIVGHDALNMGEQFLKAATDRAKASIRFYGSVEHGELDRLLETSDIALLPSRYESFGLVYVEAMARGLPVIALANDFTSEIVEDGQSGLLCAAEPAAIADALVALASNHDLRITMGEVARLRVEAHFSDQKMAECVEATYERIIDSKAISSR
jgi:glycogen(starch) synthase